MQGSIALVTGGAKRVGRAIALTLAEAGFDVAIHFNRSSDAARETAKGVESRGRRAALVQGDLSETAAPPRIIDDAAQAFGGLHILVNNASVFDPMSVDAFDASDWERTMRINVGAPAALACAARAHLREGKPGRIVNICDISAERPWPSHLAYCASKAALVNLTRSLARALAPDVLVNGLAPGIAVFPDDYDEATRQRLIDKVPLKRAGSPEDIADAVRFLAENGRYVTGQILNVDGGRSIR